MKDNKNKVKLTEEEVKKEVQTEEEGVQLTDEELSSVTAGYEEPVSQSSHENSVTFQPFDNEVIQ